MLLTNKRIGSKNDKDSHADESNAILIEIIRFTWHYERHPLKTAPEGPTL